MEKDIRNTIKIARNDKCIYCKKFYAAVYCSNKKCKNVYHFPCGFENLCLYQFENEYKSFCPEHIPAYLKKIEINELVPCLICREYIEDLDPILSAPACCNDYRFHRKCLMEYASSSGYLFRCVKCHKRTDKYVTNLRMRGIYVPDEDASWENVANDAGPRDAYSELLYRPKVCMAAECKCPKGRDYRKKGIDRDWHIEICRWCGSEGVHRKCIKRSKEQKDCLYYECKQCAPVVSRPTMDEPPVETKGKKKQKKTVRSGRKKELNKASAIELPDNTDNAPALKRCKYNDDHRNVAGPSNYVFHKNPAVNSLDSLLVEMNNGQTNGDLPTQNETNTEIIAKPLPMQEDETIVELSSDSDIDCTEIPFQSEFSKKENGVTTSADEQLSDTISGDKTLTLRDIIETNGEILLTKFEDELESKPKENATDLNKQLNLNTNVNSSGDDKKESVNKELVIATVKSLKPEEFRTKSIMIFNGNSTEVKTELTIENQTHQVIPDVPTFDVYGSSSEDDNEVFSLKKRQILKRYKGSRAPRKSIRQVTNDSD